MLFVLYVENELICKKGLLKKYRSDIVRIRHKISSHVVPAFRQIFTY